MITDLEQVFRRWLADLVDECAGEKYARRAAAHYFAITDHRPPVGTAYRKQHPGLIRDDNVIIDDPEWPSVTRPGTARASAEQQARDQVNRALVFAYTQLAEHPERGADVFR